MSLGWYVVQFTQDSNEVEVVPKNWMINFEECLWPRNMTLNKLTTAIKQCSTPSSDWTKFKIRVLSKSLVLNFNAASKMANQAQFTSDIDDLNFNNKGLPNKRQKIMNKKYIQPENSSSSDEEEDTILNDIPPFPPKPHSTGNDKFDQFVIEDADLLDSLNNDDFLIETNSSVNSHTDVNTFSNNSNTNLSKTVSIESCGIETPNIDNPQQSGVMLKSVNNSMNTSLNDLVPKCSIVNEISEIDHLQSGFQKQVMKQLVTLNARVKENNDYLHTIMMQLSNDKRVTNESLISPISAASNNTVLEIFSKLIPVKSETNINELSEKLDEDLSEAFAKRLALIGGTDFKELIRRIMRHLITDEFATNFSYTGHKGNKTPFNKTILSKLLTRAVSIQYPTVTIKDIEKTTSIWLSKATERLSKQKNATAV